MVRRTGGGRIAGRRVGAVADGVCVTHGTKRFATVRRASTTQVPGPRNLAARRAPEVTVNAKKIITWVLVAFVLFYVIKFPDKSANFVRSAGDVLGNALSQLAEFVGNLG